MGLFDEIEKVEGEALKFTGEFDLIEGMASGNRRQMVLGMEEVVVGETLESDAERGDPFNNGW